MDDEPAGHDELRVFLGAYVLGALEGDERAAALEAHLAACESCREELRRLADVATSLAHDEQAPRPDIWERIRDRIAGQGEAE